MRFYIRILSWAGLFSISYLGCSIVHLLWLLLFCFEHVVLRFLCYHKCNMEMRMYIIIMLFQCWRKMRSRRHSMTTRLRTRLSHPKIMERTNPERKDGLCVRVRARGHWGVHRVRSRERNWRAQNCFRDWGGAVFRGLSQVDMYSFCSVFSALSCWNSSTHIGVQFFCHFKRICNYSCAQ